MAQPTRARQDCRLDVLKKLDPISEPKSSSCTSDCDDHATIIDTLLAPASQFEDYVGDWIYIRNQPAAVDSGTTVDGAHNTTTTTLAVADGTKFTVDDGIQVTVSSVTETLLVTAIVANNLTVVRGIQGSTAVTMAGGETVNIVGPAIGEIARVTNVDFSGTTSTLTVAPNFSCSPVSGQEYERHRKARPSIINDKLDVILGLLRQNVIIPLTLVTDGDMETAGVGDWTDGTTDGSIAKDTTYVRHGRQSMKVTEGAGLGGAACTVFPIPASTELIVAVDCYITSGDAAKISLETATTSGGTYTERETAESDEAGWVHLEFTYTTPAAAEWVKVKLKGQTDGDIIYYDHLVVWPTYYQAFDLPSYLEYIYDIEGIFYYEEGTELPGSANDFAYKISETSPKFYAHYQKEVDDTGVVPARLYAPDKRPSHPLWLKCRKSYPVFAGATDALKDVDTTTAHRHVVANLTAASIIDDLALDATEAEKPRLSEQLQVKALVLRNEIAGLLASMTPPKKKIITTPFTRK